MRKAFAVLISLGLVIAARADASDPVRISQIYCGGGSSYRCDYVELMNSSDSPVDIGGWSIQFGVATDQGFGLPITPIPSGTTIPACGYLLVQGACDGAGGAEMPVAPDLVSSFSVYSYAGKCALLRDQITNRTCTQAAGAIVDMVGWGYGYYCTETSSPGFGDDSRVLVRAQGGLVDTDDNGADFTWELQPYPMHNSASDCPRLYPYILSIQDVPNDQGGHVTITWKASSLDSTGGIAYYQLYRSDGEYWWTLDMVDPQSATSYTHVAHTVSDSVAGQPVPWTAFRVDAVTQEDVPYGSPPGWGYSADNLAPPLPAPFTGEYHDGWSTLHWGRSPATDLAAYWLYRGPSADFVPGPTNLATVQADTGCVDFCPNPQYYKLRAVDVHGNASGFVTLLPTGTADVPAATPFTLALEAVSPNPVAGSPSAVKFTLPGGSPALLEVLDVAGRRLARHEVGSLGAGHHTFVLEEGRRLAPGVYVIRLSQGSRSCTTRMVEVN